LTYISSLHAFAGRPLTPTGSPGERSMNASTLSDDRPPIGPWAVSGIGNILPGSSIPYPSLPKKDGVYYQQTEAFAYRRGQEAR
jgi:hypothetical protein